MTEYAKTRPRHNLSKSDAIKGVASGVQLELAKLWQRLETPSGNREKGSVEVRYRQGPDTKKPQSDAL